MLSRATVLLCGIFFCHSVFAGWSVVQTKTRYDTALLQKEVVENKGSAALALICMPEPTLIVDWFENQTSISIRIDTVPLDVIDQYTIRNGMKAITLKNSHLRGLINGMELQVTATLPTGEKHTAQASLRGFASALDKASIECS